MPSVSKNFARVPLFWDSFLCVLRTRFFPSRRLGATLSSYVIQEITVPTFIAIAGLTVLILAKDILGFTDFVINRGFGAPVVLMIAFYEIVPLASRTLPFAVLIGALVGLGRLKADHEIVALQAAGVSGRRLVGPVLAFATGMMTVGLILSLFAAPWAIRSLTSTLKQMATENPGLSLRSGTVREFNGVKLIAREVSASGKQLRGVLLWLPENGQTLFAERGEIAPQNEGVMQLILYDGVMLRTPRTQGQETRFERFFQPLHDDLGKVRRHEDFLSSVSLEELAALSWGEAESTELTQRAQIELHHRLSYPVASLCFALLAVPLALNSRQFSRATGGLTGFLVTTIYYGLLQLGDGLIQADVVSVGRGVWLPNAVVALLAIVLLWRNRLALRGRAVGNREQAWVQQAQRRRLRFPRIQRQVLRRYITRNYLQMLSFSFSLL